VRGFLRRLAVAVLPGLALLAARTWLRRRMTAERPETGQAR
jgi:hypothetical protein